MIVAVPAEQARGIRRIILRKPPRDSPARAFDRHQITPRETPNDPSRAGSE